MPTLRPTYQTLVEDYTLKRSMYDLLITNGMDPVLVFGGLTANHFTVEIERMLDTSNTQYYYNEEELVELSKETFESG